MTESSDYLPISRTIRYRTDDAVQNLRIKVVMRSLEGESDGSEGRWITREKTFSWQEKIFGPREFEKYKALAAEGEGGAKSARRRKELAPLEERYVGQIEHVAAGEPIFTYVDADKFEDRAEFFEPVTTSPFEKPTPLAARMVEVQEKRGRHSELAEPFKIMYIVAQVKGRIDVTSRAEEGTKYINREEVLCAIKVYNSGNIDMTPGFSPKPNIKVDVMKGNSYKLSSDMGAPYRLETEAGCVYEYWVVNDTEPADASEVAALNIKQMRFQQELFDKTQELRRNFVGDEFEAYTDSPDLDVCKIMLNMEIVSAQDFDLDHVYVQYLLDIPEGWATGDAPQLWANTQVSKVRHVKNEEGKTTTRGIAHFGLPIDLTLWQTADVKNGSDFKEEEARGVTRMPCILLQVNSYDMWDRNRTQGYAHMNLPLTPGCSTHTVQTWRPALTQIGRMRSFFIGGTPELKDLTFAGVPTTQQSSTLSRYGFSSESAGSVTLRCHCIVQGPKPMMQNREKNNKAAEKLKTTAANVSAATKSEGTNNSGLRNRGQASKDK